MIRASFRIWRRCIRDRRSTRRPAQRRRHLFLESLEDRRLLCGDPFLATPLLHQILPTDGSGLTIGINGDDPDGDPLNIAAVSDDPDVAVFIPQGNHFARLHFTESDGTPIGSIEVELFETRGGEAASQFMTLSTTGFDANDQPDPSLEPFYTDVNVHRSIPGFIVQSGDKENGNGTGGSPLGPFDDQFDLQETLRFSGPGVLAMANSGIHTNDSQWFITDRPTPQLNFDSGNNSRHMIFGQVVAGYEDTFKNLMNRPTVPSSNGAVVDPPLLASVEIYESHQDATVTLTAAPGWDGEASLTVTLSDPDGNDVQQTIDLRTQSVLGNPPSIEVNDVILSAGETSALPTSSDDLGSDVAVEVLLQGADNTLFPSISVDNESGEWTVIADDFSGILPLQVEAREAGFSGFLPDVPRATIDVITYGPEDPRPVGRAPASPGSVTFASQRIGDTLYLANGESGIEIFDVADPSAPQSLGSFDAAGQMRDVAVVGSTALLAAVDGGLIALDVSDPQNISVLDTLSPLELAGTASGLAVALEIQGQTALIAAFVGGLVAVDFSDPTDLTVRDGITQLTTGLQLEEAVGVGLSGDRAYVTDRVGQLVTIDISDLDNLSYVAATSTGSASTQPFGISVSDERVYVADLASGLIVYGIAEGNDPAELGRLDMDGGAFQVAADGEFVIVGSDHFFYLDVADPTQIAIQSTFNVPAGAARPNIDGTQVALAAGSEGVVLIDLSDPTLMTAVSGDVLHVHAPDGLPVTITSAAGNVQINGLDPQTGAVAANSLTSIQILAGAGDNQIDVSAVDAAEFSSLLHVDIQAGSGEDLVLGSNGVDQIDLGPGDDSVTGGGGDDAIRGGSGSDLILWNNGDGSDSVDGGTGGDDVRVSGAVEADHFAVVPAADHIRLQRTNLETFTLELTNLERLQVQAGQGDDQITVNDLSGVGSLPKLELDGQQDNDTIDARALPPCLTELSLLGGDGDDRILAGSHGLFRGGAGSDSFQPLDDEDLDLSATSERDIEGVEIIDLLASGINQLTLDQAGVLRYSDATNTLFVRADDQDGVDPGPGWTLDAPETIGADVFLVYTQDVATLKILDRAPQQLQLSGQIIDEDAPDGTIIGSLSATDPDVLDIVSFALLEDAAGRFGIQGADLVVADTGLIDFESNEEHLIQVQTTDQGGLSIAESFTISVNNRNELAVASLEKAEGHAGTTDFDVSLNLEGPSDQRVTVVVTTQDGSAIAAEGDYTAVSTVVVIDAGESGQTVTIEVHGDRTLEADETLTVLLSDPTGTSLSKTSAVVTILNDDVAAPSADAGGPYAIDAGVTLQLDASGSVEHSGGGLSYAWDLNNDGAADFNTSSATANVPWLTLADLGLSAGSHTIQLTVTDERTQSDSASATLNISDVFVFAGSEDGAPDSFSLSLNNGSLEVRDEADDGALLSRVALAGIQRLQILGTSDDDTLTVDYTSGDPLPVGGIDFVAGAGNDTYFVRGEGIHLDLTDERIVRLSEIEVIDVIGNSPNQLTLSLQSLRDVTDASNSLAVRSDLDETIHFADGWSFVDTQITDGVFFRVLQQTEATLLLSGPANWQHPLNSRDVSNDGFVVPQDVLTIINMLNGATHGDLIDALGKLVDPATLAEFPNVFPDANGDGFGTPLDALNLVNFLNNPASGEGEEATGMPGRSLAQRSIVALRSSEGSPESAQPTVPLATTAEAGLWSEPTRLEPAGVDRVLSLLAREHLARPDRGGSLEDHGVLPEWLNDVADDLLP